MKVQNYKLFENYCNEDAKLRSLEKKQDSIINILRWECEKIARKPELTISTQQKLWQRKRVEANYTLKLPKSNKINERVHEYCESSWRKKAAAKAMEKKKLRTRMIEAGNLFSMKNKSSMTIVKIPKHKSAVELRQEMLAKAKNLGNQYSLILNRTDKIQRNYLSVDELDRFHRLLSRKSEAEKFFEINIKYGRKVSDSFVGKYSKLVDEIDRMGRNLKVGNRFSCGEFFG